MTNPATYTHKNCPVCYSENHFLYIKTNYCINKCENCGLLFTNPRPTEESISNYFSNNYIEDKVRFEKDFIELRNKNLLREATRIKQFLPNGGKLLDIGTASGVFLAYFKNLSNWSIIGIEPSKFAAQKAQEYWGIDVRQGFLEDQNFPDESFDAITSLDTFYFHANPEKDIQEIARILKPNGFFAIEIPGLNFRLVKNTGLIAKLIYKVPVQLNSGLHLYFYNKKNLSILFNKVGLSLVKHWPEQSPIYGSNFRIFINYSYFILSSIIYYITLGRINYSPKEFFIFKKIVNEH